jgi:hypothetical protein
MQLSCRHLGAIAIALGVAACPKSAGQPLASATAVAAVNIGSVVQLDGSKSSDPQSRQLAFSWSFLKLPAGSAATLNDPHSINPSFIADAPGAVVVQLVVANSFLVSEPVQVTIVVNDCGTNPPVIVVLTETPQGGTAGASPNPGQAVTLSATVTDADSACTPTFAETFSYAWTLTGRPMGSAAFIVPDGNGTLASVKPDLPGSYQVQLVVTDSTNRKSAPALVSFTAYPAPVTPAITAPSNATAGVTYSASVPARPGITYAWSITGGAIVSAGGTAGVASADGKTNSIQFISSTVGPASITCVETNAAGDSSTTPGQTTVNIVPAAIAPTITAPSAVTLGSTGNKASVPSRTGMTYLWTVAGGAITGPGGSTGIAVGNTNQITFVAPATAGPFLVTCSESNAAGDSNAIGSASINAVTPPAQPTITGLPTLLVVGQSYTASVTANQGMSYLWTVSNGAITSSGGAAGVTSATTNSITFTPATSGLNAERITATEVNAAGAQSTAGSSGFIDVVKAPSVSFVAAFITGGNTLAMNLTGDAGFRYSCSATNGTIAGGASGTFPASGNQLNINAAATTSNKILTVSCIETNSLTGTPQGPPATATATILPSPSAVISAPANATAGRTYAASVAARAGSHYTWNIDAGGTITSGGTVVTGGFSGVLSSDGTTNSIQFGSGGVGTRTITCVETNAAGDASTPPLGASAPPADGKVAINVVPLAVAPVVDLGQRPRLTGGVDGQGGVTAGTAYNAFATVHAANPAMTYSWTIVGGAFANGSTSATSPPGMQGTTSIQYLPSDVPLTPGTVTVLISCTETNAAGDSSATGTASVKAYPTPVAPAVTVASQMTTGKQYTGTVSARTGMTYGWAVDDNGIVSPATGSSVNITAGDANATSAKTMRVSTTEFNALNDSATTTTAVNVWPLPTASLAAPAAIGPNGLAILVPTFANGTPTLTRTTGASATTLPTPTRNSNILQRLTATTTYLLSVTNPANTTATASATVTVTTPAAGNWTSANNAPGSSPDMTTVSARAIALDLSNDSSQFLTGSNQVFRTTTGGPPWTSAGVVFGSSNGLTIAHPNGTLSIWSLSNCDGDLWHSTNGTAWTEVQGTTNGLPAKNCTGATGVDIVLDASDQSQQTVYLASSSGVFRTTSDGATWTSLSLSGGSPTKLAITDNGTVFAATSLGNLFQRAPIATAWTQLINAGTGAPAITALSVDPTGTNIVIGKGDGSILTSSNGGSSFTSGAQLGGGPSTYTAGTGGVNGLIVSADGFTYAIANRRVFRSANFGLAFSDETNTGGALLPDAAYQTVAIDPAQPQTLFVVGGTLGVFKRTFGTPPAPPSDPVTLASGLNQPSNIAVDVASTGYAYFGATSGNIGVVYKPGGKPTTIVPGPNLLASGLLPLTADLLFGTTPSSTNTGAVFDADLGGAAMASVVTATGTFGVRSLTADSNTSPVTLYFNQTDGTLKTFSLVASPTLSSVSTGTASVTANPMYIPAAPAISSNLYFCGSITVGVTTSSGLFQMPKAGLTSSAAPAQIDSNVSANGPCAFAGSFAYFTVFSATPANHFDVRKYDLTNVVSVNAGESNMVANVAAGANSSALATDGSLLYFATPASTATAADATIKKVVLTAPAAAAFASGLKNVGGLAMDGARVYWTTGDGTPTGGAVQSQVK